MSILPYPKRVMGEIIDVPKLRILVRNKSKKVKENAGKGRKGLKFDQMYPVI
jgi:hypothetical protein